MLSTARPLALLAAIVAICALPAASAAASTASFSDPVGDMPQFAADLGASTITADGDAISVETTVVPRPPAEWGGCAFYVAEACIPADMSVTWYVDHVPGAGNVADDGADTKLVVIPQKGRSLWESHSWSAAGDRYLPGPRPLGSEEDGTLRWSLRLSDLDIERPATLRVWAVSFFGALPGLGAPIDYEDRTGSGTIVLDEEAAPGATGAPGARCKRKAGASARRKRDASAGARRHMRMLSDVAVSPGRAVTAVKRRCA